MVNKLNILDTIALILVIIGGLNWGLYAISPSFDLIAMILGAWPTLAQLVYLLVGISAIYLIFVMNKLARK